MFCRITLVTLLNVSAVLASSPAPPSPEMKKAVAILQSSKDSSEIAMAACSICNFAPHDRQYGLRILGDMVQDPDLWKRLDPEEDHHRPGALLVMRLYRVLIAIGAVSDTQAEGTLLMLTENQEFKSERNRVLALCEALAKLREPSPKSLSFVAAYGDIAALANIGTMEACAVIEDRLLSDHYAISTKIGWCKLHLMPRRNHAQVVELYARLVKANVPDPKLRNMIVQTLFDYRQFEWFKLIPGPQPPPRLYATKAVLRNLLAISDVALKQDLWPETKEGVRKAQDEIKSILAGPKPNVLQPLKVPEPLSAPRTDDEKK